MDRHMNVNIYNYKLGDKLVNITCITSIYVSEVNEVLCSSENYIYRKENQQKCYYIIIFYFVNKLIA